MARFVQEYGLAIVSVILCAMFLSFMQKLNAHDDGVRFVYNNHALYIDFKDADGVTLAEMTDAINGVSNIVDLKSRPYFEKNGDLDATFKLAEVGIEDDKIFEDDNGLLKIKDYSNFKERLTSDINGNNILSAYIDGNEIDTSDIHITILEYQPEIEYITEGLSVKTVYKFNNEDALDEFGRRIYDEDENDFIKSKQLAYTEVVWQEPNEDGSLKDALDSNRKYKDINEFKINPDLPSRYKVIYRYEKDKLKCEYTALFINEVRPESDILFDGE